MPTSEPKTASEQGFIEAASRGEEFDLSAFPAGPSKTIRASVICEVATNVTPSSAAAAGVRIKGAIIQGGLDFESATIERPIELVECQFREPLSLKRAKTQSIKLAGSTVPCVDADGLVVEGILDLSDGFRSAGKVSVRGARISGDFDASKAAIGDENHHDVVLDADGIRIQGSFYIGLGFRANGEVRMRGAEIRGDLDASGGNFQNSGGTAIDADGVFVEDDVLFGWSEKLDENDGPSRFSSNGQIRLEGARIGGSLVCTGANFSNASGKSTLVANGVRVNGDFIASPYEHVKEKVRFESNGTVQLAGARIQGTFNASEGIFNFLPDRKHPPRQDNAITGSAIYADGIRVDGDIELQYSKIN